MKLTYFTIITILNLIASLSIASTNPENSRHVKANELAGFMDQLRDVTSFNSSSQIEILATTMLKQQQLYNDVQSLVIKQAIKIQELTDKVTDLEAKLNNKPSEIMERIRIEGLRFGSSWILREEGTGNYNALVARNILSEQDRRYAFWPEKYVDL